MSVTRVEELLEAFDWFDGVYKREEMEEALTLREEITPYLLDILAAVADDPELYIREEHYANTYAVVLLAHFQEPAAHLPLIRAFRLPKEQLDALWGDMVATTLPTLLYQTCNGDLAAIKELIGDREAPEFVRASAVEALTYAVARGVADREGVIAFLTGHLTGTEAEADSFYWSNIVGTISELHPEEAMVAIRRAFEEGLVDPWYVDLESIESDLARGREEMLADLRAKVDLMIPEDVHGYLEGFASFQEDDEPMPPYPGDFAPAKGRQDKKKKAKNKQAKKARKKNRR